MDQLTASQTMFLCCFLLTERHLLAKNDENALCETSELYVVMNLFATNQPAHLYFRDFLPASHGWTVLTFSEENLFNLGNPTE